MSVRIPCEEEMMIGVFLTLEQAQDIVDWGYSIAMEWGGGIPESFLPIKERLESEKERGNRPDRRNHPGT